MAGTLASPDRNLQGSLANSLPVISPSTDGTFGPVPSRAEPATGPPGRPRGPRRSKDAIRTLVLDTGVEMLREEGLGSGAERITLTRVFCRLEDRGVRLTHASVLGRIWSDQRAFQSDVITAVARGDSSDEVESTTEGFGSLFAAMDLSSAAGRRQGVSDLCRMVGEISLDELTDSASWPIWVGIWAIAASGGSGETSAATRSAITASYENLTTSYMGLYGWAIDHLGLRLRHPLTLRQMTIAISALVEGCALRDQVDRDSVRRIPRPTGVHGELEEWTLFGIGLEALVWQFVELIPRWKPPSG